MTAALIGMLVDEGVLDYDVPVKYYLNDFQMYDPFAAESLTLRDILCHRSGIGGHEGMWPSEMSHKEFLEKLRYLEPNVPFRYCSQYSSVMYTAAGYIAELAAGKPWEALVREKLIKPLGMTESGFSLKRWFGPGTMLQDIICMRTDWKKCLYGRCAGQNLRHHYIPIWKIWKNGYGFSWQKDCLSSAGLFQRKICSRCINLRWLALLNRGYLMNVRMSADLAWGG